MFDHRRKILHLIETTGPGGAETVLLSIVGRLNRDDFDSLVVVMGRGWLHEQLTDRGADVRIIHSSKANDWMFLRKLCRLVGTERVDLIHSHLDGMNFYACLGGLLTRRPVIATFHGTVGDWHGAGIKSKLKYAVIRKRATRVVAVSNYLKRELEQKWSFSSDRVTMIHNGVDFEALDAQVPKGSLRSDLGLEPGMPLIGMVGNIRAPKGYRYFVEAARLIRDRIPECRFLIVGHGEGALLHELTNQITTLGLADRVILTGFREDVAHILSQLDLFMLSSLTEGLSIATIEAMGLGRPVVVTDSGGPGEIVRDGETGFLVPPASAKALADRAVELLHNRALAECMGHAARAHVRRRFSLEQNVRSYEQLYRECLS
ncbi:MAG: glycosyltransferase family 4 protein [candidate division Zixibacteria bacterium]|nr:glycosyltransferase family 4 protein [candidate division Zixibacteria bacterium]